MADVVVTIPDGALEDLFSSREFRNALNKIAFTITAHAVPHSGVDTGRLINSMGHRVEDVDGHLEAVLGSGAGDGVEPVWYASYHWAAQADPTARPDGRDIRKHIPHVTKPSPTLPYSKAMDELGINYDIEPGGFKS